MYFNKTGYSVGKPHFKDRRFQDNNFKIFQII